MSPMENNSKIINGILIFLLLFTAILITRALADKGGPLPATSMSALPSEAPSIPKIGTTDDTTSNNQFCAQVITQAKNDETGEVKDFPTACLPDGWTRVAPISVTP